MLTALTPPPAHPQLRIACEGLISSLGRVTFDGRMGHAFTAHPKVDPATGELFGFGYGVDRQVRQCGGGGAGPVLCCREQARAERPAGCRTCFACLAWAPYVRR